MKLRQFAEHYTVIVVIDNSKLLLSLQTKVSNIYFIYYFCTFIREDERQMEADEFFKAQQAEREFQARMKQVLDDPSIDKLHPMRRAMMISGQKC